MTTLAAKLLLPGTRVRLRQDSRFYGQGSNTDGTVVPPFRTYVHGWTYVLWDDGTRFRYRVGLPNVENGRCDLELARQRCWPKHRLGAKG